MKQKISISIEEETIKQIEEKVEEGTYRNKSHCIEYAVTKLMENGRKQN